MIVMKFGGSCLSSSARLARLLEIVRDEPRPIVLVLSALQGVTDKLIELCDRACQGETSLADLRERHLESLGWLSPPRRAHAERAIAERLAELEKLLTGVSYLGEAPPRIRDRVLAFGERLSVMLATFHLQSAGLPAEALFADEAGIVTTADHGDAKILDSSRALVRRRLQGDRVFVVTGFVGRDEGGHVTTLGRGGSDYTATFIAAALGAKTVLWKDTPGIRTSDPKTVPESRVIDRMHYLDALELSHYGLKAVCEKAIYPAMQAEVPIEIRPFDGALPGEAAPQAGARPSVTVICGETTDVLAVTCVRDVVMVDLCDLKGGTGDVLRALARLFAEFAATETFPLLLTEASPRGETSLVIQADQFPRVKRLVESIGPGLERRVHQGLAVVSVIGSGMRGKVGTAAAIFESLAARGANIMAIAQTASERNVSVVVRREHAEEAVRALHERFVARAEEEGVASRSCPGSDVR